MLKAVRPNWLLPCPKVKIEVFEIAGLGVCFGKLRLEAGPSVEVDAQTKS